MVPGFQMLPVGFKVALEDDARAIANPSRNPFAALPKYWKKDSETVHVDEDFIPFFRYLLELGMLNEQGLVAAYSSSFFPGDARAYRQRIFLKNGNLLAQDDKYGSLEITSSYFSFFTYEAFGVNIRVYNHHQQGTILETPSSTFRLDEFVEYVKSFDVPEDLRALFLILRSEYRGSYNESELLTDEQIVELAQKVKDGKTPLSHGIHLLRKAYSWDVIETLAELPENWFDKVTTKSAN